MITAYLGRHDTEVIVETRGDRAEATILAADPELVLLDIMLPGKDGMTLCHDLRARWQGPIVLLTSLDSYMNHILALEIGANDYILKTTPPAVLLARLHLHQAHAGKPEVTPAKQSSQKVLRFWLVTIDSLNLAK